MALIDPAPEAPAEQAPLQRTKAIFHEQAQAIEPLGVGDEIAAATMPAAHRKIARRSVLLIEYAGALGPIEKGHGFGEEAVGAIHHQRPAYVRRVAPRDERVGT